jgi:peptide/nickel transport system substrate-binding protein
MGRAAPAARIAERGGTPVGMEQQRREVADLVRRFAERRISRRQFTARAVGLGLSLPLATHIARVYGASAQSSGGGENPITVTVNGTPIPSAAEDTSNATPGGTLRFARPEDSDNLDPVTNTLNVNIWVLMNVYDQLARVAPNGIELEPALAEKWDISDDALTYTFHLRSGIKFSDGTPMTSRDVKFSVERAKNDPSQTWTFSLTALEAIETPDDTTVVMKLNQPWAPFLSDIAMFNSSVISEAFAQGKEARLTQEMMGTGPFMLKEWRKGEYLLLEKNPHYWEEGLPFLDGVRLAVVPDDNSRVLQLQGNELDAIGFVPFSRVPEFRADPNIKLIEFPSTYSQYVVLNHKSEPLDDPNVRLALNYATDKQALIQVVLFGSGLEATSFMPKGALYWNDQLPGFPYDVAKAKELLAKSKAPNGFKLELQYLGGLVDDEQLANALKDMWSQIGVDVQLTPVEQSLYYDVWTNEQFQAWIGYWTNDIIDPDELVTFLVLPDSSNHYHTGWSNQEAMDLAKKAATEMDPEQRRQDYYRIQEIFNAEAPMVLLFHKPYLDAMSPKVHNFQHPPTGQWVWKGTWIEQ